MAELTTTSHAILGLLSRRDWTTYELAQQMHRRLFFVWPRAERKLYEEPGRLVAAGFATSQKDMVGRRARTIYSITPAGREELRCWLSTQIEPPLLEFDGVVRVMFSDQGDLGQMRDTLHQIDEQARAAQAHFEPKPNRDVAASNGHRSNAISNVAGTGQPRLDALAARLMIGHFENISGWAQWALGEIDSWADTEQPVA